VVSSVVMKVVGEGCGRRSAVTVELDDAGGDGDDRAE